MLRLFLLTVAVGSGAAAAWVVGSSSEPQAMATMNVEAPPVRSEEVLVAAADVEQGSALLPEHMTWRAWPAEAVGEGFITRSARAEATDELAGSLVRGRLVAGTPILAGSLAPEGSNLLSSVLSPGMRAVAIAISAGKTAGGFVLPNDRVDVLLATSCSPDQGCSSGTTVRTILQNVRVLAIDQSDDQPGGNGTMLGKTATLELAPAQAEAIVAAEASGTLSLILRSASDGAEQRRVVEERGSVIRIRRGGVAEYMTIR